MAVKKATTKSQQNWREVLAEDTDWLRDLVQQVVQEVLEAEMDEALQAGKGERTASRLGYRAGYYGRTLVTRVGKLELRVPQGRKGRFSTEFFGATYAQTSLPGATAAEFLRNAVHTLIIGLTIVAAGTFLAAVATEV